MKQTAVEWLINEIDMQYPGINIKWKEWTIDKAKEMEKEQACGFVRDYIDDKCYASFKGCMQCSGSVEITSSNAVRLVRNNKGLY